MSNPQTESVNLVLGVEELASLSTLLRSSRFLKSMILMVKGDVDKAGAAALEPGLQKNRSLKELTLKLKIVSSGALKSIFEAIVRNPCIISLDLSHTSFPTNNQTQPELSGLVSPSLNLRLLKLANCRLQPSELSVIGTILSRSTCVLTYLDLSGNSLSQTNVSTLVTALKNNPKVNTLKMAHCSLGDDGITQLASIFPQNTTLSHLNISSNNIGPIGAKALSVGIENSAALGHLNLSHNPLLYDGISCIFTALTWSDRMRELNLGFCSFDAATWTFVSQKLNSCTQLWKLDLSGNMFFKTTPPAPSSSNSEPPSPTSTLETPQEIMNALDELCRALQVSSSLASLDLSHNNLGDLGCKTLGSMLAANRSIVDLKLRRCGITSYGISQLADSMADNTELSFVDTTGNEAEGLGHLEVTLTRNRRRHALAWTPLGQHPIVQQKPHAEFTCVCPVPLTEEVWVACTDGHVHFWATSDHDNQDDVMHYVDVHTRSTPVTRRRINAMVACKSTIWVLTDESTIVVISQSRPHRISFFPMPDLTSERLCMDIVDHENQIAVLGGGSGDISLWKTSAGEESMISRKILGSGLPVVSVCVTPDLIFAGMVMPGRHSSMVVVLDHSLDELYRQEVGNDPLQSMTSFGTNKLVTTFLNQTTKLWHCDSREMSLIRVESHIPIQHMQAFGPDILVSSSQKRSSLCIWHPANLNPICTLDTQIPVKSFCIAGNTMALLTEDEQVGFWSMNDAGLS